MNIITVSFDGYILYSNNSATNWYQGSSGTTTNLYCLAHSSSLIAMVGGLSSFVAKTSNGGKTWTQMSVFPSTVVDVRFHSISMLSDTVAYVAGSDGTVYMTTDGGSSWSRIASTGAYFLSLSVYDTKTAVAGAASGSGIYMMVPGK